MGSPSGVCGGRDAVGDDHQLGHGHAVEELEEGKPGSDREQPTGTDSNNSTKERRHVQPNHRVERHKAIKRIPQGSDDESTITY